jgi:hypothetical protein
MFFKKGDLKKRHKGNKANKIIPLFLCALIVSFSLLAANPAPARAELPVADIPNTLVNTWSLIWEKVQKVSTFLWQKGASSALKSAIRNTLNTIAYDTATWAGSGGEGQKPQWLTGDVGTTLANVSDQAAGQFISGLNDEFGINLCEPNLSVKLSIGLGLVEQVRPPSPDCTASQMVKNWNESLSRKDFLKNFSDYFDISQNDMGIALTTQTNLLDKQTTAQINEQTRFAGEGSWLNIRNIAGKITGTPGQAEMDLNAAKQAQTKSLGEYTGDAVVDAINVFLNQLAITAFQKAMRSLTSDSSKNSGNAAIANPFAAQQSGGTASVQGVLRKVVQPQFSSRGDYNILNQLTICNTGIFGVGPTDCVIDERFRQAVENQKTVGEALSEGLLKADAPFGFMMSGLSPIEPDYKEGYPYRSMLILRKYRIIPVGWEIAAEYIRTHDVDDKGQSVRNNAYLGKLVECFDENDSYGGYYADWCRGLVDPSWVLKAPQNYCAREGYGPQILNSQTVEQGTDGKGNEQQPKLSLVRADSYCADEKSCIKEKSDGSCEFFGYCSEEKRKWKFGESGSCDPQYNTCQMFVSETGKTVSYLKNSLAYCDSSQAGCEKYARASAEGYDAAKVFLNWTKNSGFIFLNKNAQSCENENEGCHEFLRIASGLGSNLAADSGFDKAAVGAVPSGWTAIGNAVVTGSLPERSGQAVLVDSGNSPAGISSRDRSAAGNVSVLPEGFAMEPEISYTLSADVYLSSGEKVAVAIGREGNYWQEQSTALSGVWQRLTVTIVNNSSIGADGIKIYGTGASVKFYVDNVKFEIGNKSTYYSEYRAGNLLYEKFMPAYLRDACYADPNNGDFRLKDNAPAACQKFARQCNRDEANCELYTNTADNGKTAAAVTDLDYCAKECVGYSSFVGEEDNFSLNHAKYFIPDTAKSCTAEAVGCEEFTNLDKLSSGGEQKEYYSYLRQCVKPGDAGAACGDFYSWEGNRDQGQQLVKFSLKQDAGGNLSLTSGDTGACDEATFKKSVSDPAYNPDCRQFYDKQGRVSYHLYSRTITCSEDCHPYRLTKKEKADNALSSSDCVSGYGGHWDGASQSCFVCKNGGAWDDAQNSCVYKAVASESLSCEASSNGCAKYSGTGGANSRLSLASEFENSDDGGWSGGSLSRQSYVAGKSSYLIGGSGLISNKVGLSAVSGASYVLRFLARAENGEARLSAELGNGVEAAAFEKPVSVKSGQWQLYSLNLPKLGQAVNENETLTIRMAPASATVYIDSIKLEQVIDLYYLIEDSWITPAKCDQDINGNPHPLYMLGCAEYSDRFNRINYLHNFSRVCQESAVGCEAMIDTANSADEKAAAGAAPVAADHLFYAVYDQNKLCGSADKGCERLGLASEYEGQSSYKDVYLKNNPDLYSNILCNQSGVGCNLFSSAGSQSYFKDPGEMACEYRQGNEYSKNNGWGWYKKKVKLCGGTGAVCSSDKDCSASACRDAADAACPTEKLKTIGGGGSGNEILQPGSDGVFNWAGLCPEEQSGCTEYIDPVSDFSGNAIINADFSQHIGSNDVADGWDKNNNNKQNISLEGNNLYVLAVEGDNRAAITIGETGEAAFSPFYVLGTDNNFSAAANTVSVDSSRQYNNSVIFYVDRNARDQVSVRDIKPRSAGNNSKIILRKVITDYQFAANADKTTCRDANPSEGCIYFNERAVDSSGNLSLLERGINPWEKYKESSIVASYVANELVKVRPDRACGQWLACKSYVKDENNNNVCLDIANCNRSDASGNCVNFTVLNDEQKKNRTYDYPNISAESPETIKNLTGYVKVGYDFALTGNDKNIPGNLLNFGNISQVGKNVIVPNGDFEFFTATSTDGGKSWQGRPSNWSSSGGKLWSPDTADSLFSVVSDSRTAQNQGIAYPMNGQGFLKYNANDNGGNFPRSGVINLENGGEYYLSFYLNTSGLGGSTDAKALIQILDKDGNAIDSHVEEGPGNGWILKTLKFTAPSKAISLSLGSKGGAAGNIYIDDIEITPVLLARDESKPGENDQFYSRQICRLYPKEDSLSCEYYDNIGILEKGERGYCLEYDRVPGDPNACLLWWPIDKVKGSGIQTVNQVKGYSGKMPLYYCKRLADRPYIDPANFHIRPGKGVSTVSVAVNGTPWNLAERVYLNYGKNTITTWSSDGFIGMEGSYYSYNGGSASASLDIPYLACASYAAHGTWAGLDTTTQNCGGGCFDLQNSDEPGVANGCSHEGTMLHNCSGAAAAYFANPAASSVFAQQEQTCTKNNGSIGLSYTFYISPACGQIANVVDGNGQNKAWTERVRQGSDFSQTCNEGMPASSALYLDNKIDSLMFSIKPAPGGKCVSTATTSPFGSVNPPAGNGSLSFLSDPTLWPTILPYKSLDAAKTGEMGQLYATGGPNSLSNLFAQSYGVWDWDAALNRYAREDAENWSATTELCPGNKKTAAENCAVAPEVKNIKLNNILSATLFGRGFVNLTFNSLVNSEQTPLASFEIDWGDGETLSVTGADMNARPNPDDPHSAFHAYDYYDLLNKYNEGKKNGDGYKTLPTLFCDDAKNICEVKPRVKITDNWGWCSEGMGGTYGSCPIIKIDDGNAANDISGYCVNLNKITNNNRCWSDNTIKTGSLTCPGTYPYCADGWYESSGKIIVRKE